MWPNRVSNPGPLTCESGALPTALRGPAHISKWKLILHYFVDFSSRKQSNISEKLKKGMYSNTNFYLFFCINTPGSVFDISDHVHA